MGESISLQLPESLITTIIFLDETAGIALNIVKNLFDMEETIWHEGQGIFTNEKMGAGRGATSRSA